MIEETNSSEKPNIPQLWIFTFGYGHAHPNRYIKIHGTYQEAREKMVARFGSKWAFQYSAEMEPELNSFNIQEIKEIQL